jgi:hypothetical protein
VEGSCEGNNESSIFINILENSWVAEQLAVSQDGFNSAELIFFVIPFYLQSVLVRLANCVKTCTQ